MVWKWVLGAVAVAGFGLGVVAAGSSPRTVPHRAPSAQVQRLYRTEVALNAARGPPPGAPQLRARRTGQAPGGADDRVNAAGATHLGPPSGTVAGTKRSCSRSVGVVAGVRRGAHHHHHAAHSGGDDHHHGGASATTTTASDDDHDNATSDDDHDAPER